MEGWRLASRRLRALPRIKRGALGRVCGWEGGGVLPLPRAAAVSTGWRVHTPAVEALGPRDRGLHEHLTRGTPPG